MRKVALKHKRNRPVQVRKIVSRSVAPCRAIIVLLATVATSIKTASKLRLPKRRRYSKEARAMAFLSGFHLNFASRVPGALTYIKDMHVIHARSFYFLHAHDPYSN